MSLGTAGYGKNPAGSSFFLLTQLMEAAVFPREILCSEGLGCPHRLFQKSVPQ